MATHLQHLHSNKTTRQPLVDRTVLHPKEPSANSLLEGEIAVNYATGLETLFIKNNNNEIVSFETAKATKNLVSITYADLVTLKAGSHLIPGQMYRITDYVTKVYTQFSDTATYQTGDIVIYQDITYKFIANHSAGQWDANEVHQINDVVSKQKAFDIIVTATDINKLSEDAKAIKHPVARGDIDYFEHANMEAWELKYCLENDTNRFGWAGDNNKGVIYYMKDEWGNECPYDFKNIQFYTSVNGMNQPCFTFTWAEDNQNTVDIFDASLIGHTLPDSNGEIIGTVNNVIPPLFVGGKQELNYITFVSSNVHDGTYYGICDNVFGKSCCYMAFGNNCSYNSVGNHCHDMTIGDDCLYSNIGNGVNGITISVNSPIIIEEYNQFLVITCNYEYSPKAITIKQGYHHGTSTNVKTITIDNTHTNNVLIYKSSDTTEITS